jgi:DNA-binding LacI/PurR family transcriptional regulator
VFAACESLGIRVLLSVYRPGTEVLAEFDSLVGRRIDGILLTNGGDISPEVIADIYATGIPVVLIENHVDQPVSAVVADNFQAGYSATSHLLELGHRRIGILRGSDRYISLTDRARGALAAVWEAGIEPDRALMPPQEAHTAQKGYAQTRHLLGLSKPPTAIYAVSDKSALGAYQAIQEAGLAVPTDISVVATDNVEESAFRNPPLTTFDVRAADLGRVALEKLAAIRAGDQVVTRTIVRGHLERRQSTQAYA